MRCAAPHTCTRTYSLPRLYPFLSPTPTDQDTDQDTDIHRHRRELARSRTHTQPGRCFFLGGLKPNIFQSILLQSSTWRCLIFFRLLHAFLKLLALSQIPSVFLMLYYLSRDDLLLESFFSKRALFLKTTRQFEECTKCTGWRRCIGCLGLFLDISKSHPISDPI